MTKEEFRAFLDKSGVPISYVARHSGVGRTQLSYFLNDYKDISREQKVQLKNFIEEYEQRWTKKGE